jgi:acylphosphatase
MLVENMTKKRATIIISGDVQDVGFRGLVMRLAQKAELFGYVENMPDGSVRAICEGEEKAIKGFVKKLDIRNGNISVEKVDVKWSKAQGKFKYFEVKYSDLGAEMFQGFATAGRMLGDVRLDIKAMHTDLKEGFSDLKNETKEGFSDLKNETIKTHEKLDGIGNTLGDVVERYGEFGEKMTKLEHDIGDLTYQIKRLVDHVVGEETNKN